MKTTIPALARNAAKHFGDKTALISPLEMPVSFAQIDRMADQFAKSLMREGMAEGERVGIWAPNMWEWVASAIGVQRAGGVLIPIFERYRGLEVADIVARGRICFLVCTAELAQLLRPQTLTGLKRVIVLRAGDAPLRGIEESWQDFLSHGENVSNASLHERESRVTADTVCDIMFTSGTTGRPKGAVFTHRATVSGGENMRRFISLTEKDRFCPMGPFSHIGGYKCGWVAGLLSGATICWGNAHKTEAILELVSTLGVTVMPAPPIVWQGVLDHPNREAWDISSLRMVSTGGTMIPVELVRRLVSELDINQVATGYGMTETSGMNSYTRPDDPAELVVTTSGQAAPDTEIRIVDAEGRRLGPGETGEILVRNPRLMREYLDDPDITKATLEPDGWLHTGDVGCLDAEGYLSITDRLKDMYIMNGFNVYPAEVERLIETLPNVEECAVVGIPHSVQGEIGLAFIVRSNGAELTENDVLEWCRQNLASYKVPKHVSFVDHLPRNIMGKVLKNDLRTRLAQR